MFICLQEGTTFLNKNLTEWKKPYLMPASEDADEDETPEEADEDQGGSSDDAPVEEPPAKKGRLSKATTMVGTAKVGYL